MTRSRRWCSGQPENRRRGAPGNWRIAARCSRQLESRGRCSGQPEDRRSGAPGNRSNAAVLRATGGSQTVLRATGGSLTRRVSSRSKASRGNSRCVRFRLEIESLSGQPVGDAISSVSRSSHRVGNRAVKRLRDGDCAPVVPRAIGGGGSARSPSRTVERATVRGRFGDPEPNHPLGTRRVVGFGESRDRDHRLGNQRVIGLEPRRGASRGQPGGVKFRGVEQSRRMGNCSGTRSRAPEMRTEGSKTRAGRRCGDAASSFSRSKR